MSKQPDRARIIIDGLEQTVDSHRNLLEVALELGLDLPYFCWHPALGSVGACRQCAVTQYHDENDSKGRVVMACMTPCSDGLRVSLTDAQAAEMREAVIEMLMTNHPHDCPVCEEGGNCHLQDMTVMTGHAYRRYRHTKRTHRNQNLGPLVAHEMNRCIACYRCVRYYREYAGGDDLNVFGAHNHVFFGRAEDGTLESPFAGNLVEVCPTGVFTDKPYGDRYSRKWDLQQAPGICTHCSVGCNTLPGERYGLIKRIENRYHGELNGYFLCDRGRYGYDYSNAADRPTTARAGASPLPPAKAIEQLAKLLGEGQVAGIGSPRASVETNFALRQLVGEDNYSRGESALATGRAEATRTLLCETPVRLYSVRDVERATAALVLGEDFINTGARLTLALRQMTRQAGFKAAAKAHVPAWQDHSVRLVAQDLRSPLYLLTANATGLDDVAAKALRLAPNDTARLGHAIAHEIDPDSPAVEGLPADQLKLAGKIAKKLLAAARPLLLSGSGSADVRVLQATRAIALAYFRAKGKAIGLVALPAECNTLGQALLGGQDLESLGQRIEAGEIRTLIVTENNLYRRLPVAKLRAWRAKLNNLVVLDSVASPMLELATLVLPAATAFEADGSYVNFEGRAQRSFQTFAPEGDQRASWCWLSVAAAAAGIELGQTLDELAGRCAATVPALAGLTSAAPGAEYRAANTRLPRQPHRYSGRTAMHANRDVHEERPPIDLDTALAFSMEGAAVGKARNNALRSSQWAPGWNSPQSVNKFQAEIGGSLRDGDPGQCLIEPVSEPVAGGKAPPIPGAREELVAVPLQQLFGSEELSLLAPAIQQRGQPRIFIALHPETAQSMRIEEGAMARFAIGGQEVELTVRFQSDLAPRAAGLPFGLTPLNPNLYGKTVKLIARDLRA